MMMACWRKFGWWLEGRFEWVKDLVRRDGICVEILWVKRRWKVAGRTR
jgi:hypothetical protein